MSNDYLNTNHSNTCNSDSLKIISILSKVHISVINEMSCLQSSSECFQYLERIKNKLEKSDPLYLLANIKSTDKFITHELFYIKVIEHAQQERLLRTSKNYALIPTDSYTSHSSFYCTPQEAEEARASYRPIKLDFIDQDFKKTIENIDLTYFNIFSAQDGLSKYDQCINIIDTDIALSKNPPLLDFLKEGNTHFKKWKKILSKTLYSTDPYVRIESKKYIKDIGLNEHSNDLIFNLMNYAPNKWIENELREIIRKAQQKNSKSKLNKHNFIRTVLIQKGSVESLQLTTFNKKSKARVLLILFERFLKMSNDEKLKIIEKTHPPIKTKDSHKKTDFTVPVSLNIKIDKYLNRHRISMQELTNILVSNAHPITPDWLIAHSKMINEYTTSESTVLATKETESESEKTDTV